MEALFQLGTASQGEEALKYLQRVLELDPGHALALYNCGMHHAELGSAEASRGCLRGVLSLERCPGDLVAKLVRQVRGIRRRCEDVEEEERWAEVEWHVQSQPRPSLPLLVVRQ